jgi:hypothetical protein
MWMPHRFAAFLFSIYLDAVRSVPTKPSHKGIYYGGDFSEDEDDCLIEGGECYQPKSLCRYGVASSLLSKTEASSSYCTNLDNCISYCF